MLLYDRCQYNNEIRFNSSIAADETNGLIMTHPEAATLMQVQAIDARYVDETGPYTQEDLQRAWLKAVYDPVSEGFSPTNPEFYYGMGQQGSKRWAWGESDAGQTFPQWHHFQILTHYYTGIQIRDSSGNVLTPSYRWVPLRALWGFLPDPPALSPNATTIIDIIPQNSGAVDWPAGALPALAGQWQAFDGTVVKTDTISLSPNQTVLQGSDAATQQLWVTAPLTSGSYSLMIDMIDTGGNYFHDREPGWPWFTLNYEICVNPCPKIYIYLPMILKSY